MPRLLSVVSSGVLFLCLVAPATLRGQSGTELRTKVAESGYPREWPPGPPASSAPQWAQNGRIRFSCWDGGPLETCKAFLSGWPNFNPPNPDYLDVMTNWLEPRTIRFLREGHVNLVYATFGIGYSIETETRQRELLRAYIDECQRQGIRVMAYETIANIFWEDMFERVPESRNWVARGEDGKPIPYGAADYSKTGRATRYMVNTSNPQWRNYLKQLIDLAIDAGADGIMYDNCLASHQGLASLFQELVPYALSKKKDCLVMANLHARDFILNRLLNAITTEDGGEAGIFYEKTLKGTANPWLLQSSNRWLQHRDTMLPVEGGYLVNHIGQFRVFENLSEGWKPVMIESGDRELGLRETHVMTAQRHQLVMAENMMFSIANEPVLEGRFAYGLWYGEPEIVRVWSAIGQYNRFFAEHEDYYRGTKSVATLAVVLDNTSKGIPVLNALASRKVLYHVYYEHEVTPEKLKPYAAVALLSADMVRDRAILALETYVADGGKLFVAGKSASQDETGRPRQRPGWFGQKHGKGESTYWKTLPSVDELAATLRGADRTPLVRVEAPTGVLYNVRQQPETGRLMIHLVNYLPRPVDKVTVTIQGKRERVKLLTPDGAGDRARIVRPTDEVTEVEVPQVTVYSVLAFGPER